MNDKTLKGLGVAFMLLTGVASVGGSLVSREQQKRTLKKFYEEDKKDREKNEK